MYILVAMAPFRYSFYYITFRCVLVFRYSFNVLLALPAFESLKGEQNKTLVKSRYMQLQLEYGNTSKKIHYNFYYAESEYPFDNKMPKISLVARPNLPTTKEGLVNPLY